MIKTRETHIINADGQILGRLATQIAVLLRGKNKVGFTYNQDNGDFVQVVNPAKIMVTGNKLDDKKYYRHSLYPGGIKEKTLKEMLATKPEMVISEAVRRMLPDNRLRNEWMKRLTFTKNEND